MKEKLFLGLIITGLALLLIFVGICIFWSIYAFAKYGSSPISEIPAWALWFMFGGRR